MLNFLKLLSILSGNILQFYDFTIYAFLTSYISQNFFNFKDKFLSIFFTFLIFSCGYLSRPLGALIFGYFGDTKGRSKALSKSIGISMWATFFIGLIPNYTQIGILAPITLIILRFLQGISVSGEEGGSVVLLFEKYHLKNEVMGPYVLSSVLIGVFFGVCVCNITNYLISTHLIPYWWWRIPFIFSLPFGFFLYKYRYYFNDFQSFEFAKENGLINDNPVKSLFLNNFGQVVFSILLVSIYSVSTSTLIVFLPHYLSAKMNCSDNLSMTILGLSIFFIILFAPIISKILNQTNPAKIYQFSLVGFVIFSPILFFLIGQKNIYMIFLGFFIFSGLISILSSTIFSLLIKLFPYGIRCTAISFSFNMAITIFSSSTPLILILIDGFFSNIIAPGIYISGLSLLVLLLLKFKFNPILSSKSNHFLHQEDYYEI